MKKKRRPIWAHVAWGVAFGGEYESSLKLSYNEDDAWWIAAFKCNQIKKGGKVTARIKTELKKRGVGICRVRVTHQQLNEEN